MGTELIQGKIAKNIGISISFVAGIVPNAPAVAGMRIGVGVTLAMVCVSDCIAEISVGVVASAILVVTWFLPECILGPQFWGLGCFISYGGVMKIMCCSLNINTGEESCGKGGSSGKGNGEQGAAVANN